MPFAGPAAAVLARSAVIAILLMVMSGGANSQSDGQGAGASGGAEEQQPVQEPGAAGAGAEPQEEAQEPGEPGADEEPQEEAQEPGEPGAVAEPQAIQDPDAGRFVMRILSGGAPNELVVPSVVSTSPGSLSATTIWNETEGRLGRGFCNPIDKQKAPARVGYTREIRGQDETVFRVSIEAPPCWWPPVQAAHLRITGAISGKETTLFEGAVLVSVLWLPVLVTLIVILIIYPGCALVAWYVRFNRYRRKRKADLSLKPPSFWGSLDPVQITANTYGRGSLSKLQIFVFTLAVFGMLLFFQFRNGFLANLSEDIMLLLGISAVGAAGSKITYTAKRRLSLDNWSWLRRRGWLPEKSDVAQRARWADLFTDTDTKEFNIYSFQMAIFSLVVVVALISTNAVGLAAFEIPPQLLALLGLSQVVYISGMAIEKTGFQELNDKLSEVRQHETKFREAKARADAETQETERKEFKASAAQAADMFWACYEDQLKTMPAPLAQVDRLEPEAA